MCHILLADLQETMPVSEIKHYPDGSSYTHTHTHTHTYIHTTYIHSMDIYPWNECVKNKVGCGKVINKHIRINVLNTEFKTELSIQQSTTECIKSYFGAHSVCIMLQL